MKHERYLDQLIKNKLFYFNQLNIVEIDNEPVAKIFSPSILEQEICLFADKIDSGDEYCRLLHQKILNAMKNRQPLPVVRFADGEYAFYQYTLACNGLYKQAESVQAIRNSMSQHIDAIAFVATQGLLAPLVFPGNTITKTRGLLSFLRKKPDSSAVDFFDLLESAGISLTRDNYIPFYVIYAYLTSAKFAAEVSGRNICILNSEYNKNNCRNWFAEFSSHPKLSFVDIPAEYVATRWTDIKKEILEKIPSNTDLCLVGAGVGALLICADVAKTFSIPAIDAGHVINMMNGQVYKSGAIRLYTLRKK